MTESESETKSSDKSCRFNFKVEERDSEETKQMVAPATLTRKKSILFFAGRLSSKIESSFFV